MSYTVVTDPCWIGPWVAERAMPAGVGGECTALGLAKDGDLLVSGALFTHYNGWNVNVHLAIEDKHSTALLFTLIGRYVFEQLNLGRLTIFVLAGNLPAVKLYKRLGAVQEGRMFGAGENGDDILIFRLTHECVYWRRTNGQQRRKRPGSAGLQLVDPPARAVEHSAVAGWRGDWPDEHADPVG